MKGQHFFKNLTLKFSPSCNHGTFNMSLNFLYLYFQFYILPYLNLSLLILTLVYLPINLVPYPVVWLYDKILWMTEPVLMVAEIILALNFVMHCSQRVIEKIEEDDSNLWKVIIMSANLLKSPVIFFYFNVNIVQLNMKIVFIFFFSRDKQNALFVEYLSILFKRY